MTEPETTMKLLSEAGIQLSEITSQLLVDGLNSFSDSFDSLISKIRNKQKQLTLVYHNNQSLNDQFHKKTCNFNEYAVGLILVWR